MARRGGPWVRGHGRKESKIAGSGVLIAAALVVGRYMKTKKGIQSTTQTFRVVQQQEKGMQEARRAQPCIISLKHVVGIYDILYRFRRLRDMCVRVCSCGFVCKQR